MESILECPSIGQYLSIIDNMYRLGWDERNGGNVSMLLTQNEVREYVPAKIIREIPLPIVADEILRGKTFAITRTGGYFRNTKGDPEHNIGIITVSDDGKTALLHWGFKDDGSFTSEVYAHLMCHAVRLKANPENRVVMHTHPTNLLTLTHLVKLDEKELTLALWRTMTESIVVFPEGVGVLPWMLCGTNEIGVATAEKMKEYRVVIWSLHGVYGSGATIDEAFGLIETVEKAAAIMMGELGHEVINDIDDEGLKAVAKHFGLTPRPGYLK